MAAEGMSFVPPAEVPTTRQWGRGRMAAEGYKRNAIGGALVGTSMGPRPDGRGRPSKCWPYGAGTVTSMGPRPDGRGRSSPSPWSSASAPDVNGAAAGWPRKDAFDSSPMLNLLRQWGRGRMAAEGKRLKDSAMTKGLRQWGRGRMAAEGLHGRAGCAGAGHVNGAAAGWPRKVPPWTAAWLCGAARQWGRGRMAAEGPLQRAICPAPQAIAHNRLHHVLHSKHLRLGAPAGSSALLPDCERPARRAPCRGRSHAPARPAALIPQTTASARRSAAPRRSSRSAPAPSRTTGPYRRPVRGPRHS